MGQRGREIGIRIALAPSTVRPRADFTPKGEIELTGEIPPGRLLLAGGLFPVWIQRATVALNRRQRHHLRPGGSRYQTSSDFLLVACCSQEGVPDFRKFGYNRQFFKR